MADMGSHRGRHSRTLLVRNRLRPPKGMRRASHRGCIFDSNHAFAESVPVNVMRARASHQFAGHIVDGHCVLVVVEFSWLSSVTSTSPGVDVEGDTEIVYSNFVPSRGQ